MPLSWSQLNESFDKNGEILGRKWLFSPEPFFLSKKQSLEIQSLGKTLFSFQGACEKIYFQSVKETLPFWISRLLDGGKPNWLLETGKKNSSKFLLLRPDLLLTKEGFVMTELDSVPGGMGITAYLMKQFSSAGFDLGISPQAIQYGMHSFLPKGGEIWISQEAGEYKKEMEWLIQEMNHLFPDSLCFVLNAESASIKNSLAVYRFFELFDWESVPEIQKLAELSSSGKIKMPLPLKAFWEEKLWFALFSCPQLQKIWKENLRVNHLSRLQKIIPFSWLLADFNPSSPWAVLPKLETQSWQEVAEFGRSKRHLVLKRSGFHPEAWGGKSVFIGHDLSVKEWKEKIYQALKESETSPWLMQEYQDAKIVEHPYYASDGKEKILEGRVRICPYYFYGEEGQILLGGALATIVSKEKKKIHGMSDSILVPCVFT